ncbi:hypothetical protein F511_46607 [Dorcoceras hygrometricum]|uniref:Uncharacterized protein n=1 Tax=Dorcoceras hygrometricum TaxID=472368 RepID=A0A2Z7A002_9LAMI|nr:hypothetical protein F511_46607 [Dorcoceras hygrometricum]
MVAGRLRHGWSRCARPLAPLLHVTAGRHRARWSRVLHDDWPLDVARDGRRWAALFETKRRYWPTMIAQASGIVARYWPAVVESRCAAACEVVRAAVRPCGARNFHGGVGRPPLRRCSGESPAMS